MQRPAGLNLPGSPWSQSLLWGASDRTYRADTAARGSAQIPSTCPTSLIMGSDHGLAKAIKDQLIQLEWPSDLNCFIELDLKTKNRLRELRLPSGGEVHLLWAVQPVFFSNCLLKSWAHQWKTLLLGSPVLMLTRERQLIQTIQTFTRFAIATETSKQIFNKTSATFPPLQSLWSLIFCLVPLPKRRVSYLLAPEQEVTTKYISTSPAGAGFFFVDKKDQSCINYRGLTEINAKNQYPFPLISFAFKPLKGAEIFSKLDLQNAYQLVRIRKVD